MPAKLDQKISQQQFQQQFGIILPVFKLMFHPVDQRFDFSFAVKNIERVRAGDLLIEDGKKIEIIPQFDQFCFDKFGQKKDIADFERRFCRDFVGRFGRRMNHQQRPGMNGVFAVFDQIISIAVKDINDLPEIPQMILIF
jgi:hypothetical protein